MYYKAAKSPKQLEKELAKYNREMWDNGIFGVSAYVSGDELIIRDSSGFLTREDHVFFFARLIEVTARTENWESQKFLDEVQKVIDYRNKKRAEEAIE